MQVERTERSVYPSYTTPVHVGWQFPVRELLRSLHETSFPFLCVFFRRSLHETSFPFLCVFFRGWPTCAGARGSRTAIARFCMWSAPVRGGEGTAVSRGF